MKKQITNKQYPFITSLVFLIIVFSAFGLSPQIKSNNSPDSKKSNPSAPSSKPTSVTSLESSTLKSEYDYQGVIISALKNPSSDVKIRALEIIRESPAKFSPEKIKPLLTEEKDIDVKIQAAITLATMNDPAGIRYLRSLAFNKPKLSPSPTVAERVKYFSAQNIRIKAINHLGKLKDTSSLSIFEGLTKDEDGRVADAAWMALAYLGDKKGIDIFVSGLRNADRAVRAKASEVVGDIGAVEGLPLLRERLSDWDKDVRISAVHSVAKLKDLKSAPRLREIILTDKEQSVREAAAKALGVLGDSSFENISFLKKYISDENVAVRLAICHSLARLGDYSGKNFVRALAERGAEKEARYSAVRALADFVLDEDDKKFLSDLIYDEDPLISLEALRIISNPKKN